MTSSFAIVVPTADRRSYLAPLLEDLGRQDGSVDHQVYVVDDSEEQSARAVVDAASSKRFTPLWVPREGPPGLNSARNTGLRASREDVVVFLDDDVRVGPGWLAALAAGAERWPEAECFAGRITQRIQEGHPAWCGREPFPITALDAGPSDRFIDVAYGANWSLRRSATERIGTFDEDAAIYGDEMDWVLRLRRAGGSVAYLAGWDVVHTRRAEDVSVPGMLRQARRRGRNVAAFDRRLALDHHGLARNVASGIVHAVRRRCWVGLVVAVESASLLRHGAGRTGAVAAILAEG